MQARAIRQWAWVHTWTSLICTLALIMLCITGLPLIFHDEIEAMAGEQALSGPASARTGGGLDAIVARAKDDYARTAGHAGVPLFIGFSGEDPLITVTVGPRADAAEAEMRLFSYDRSTGRAVGEVHHDGVMAFLLELHTDLLLGLPGMLFLGAMGVLFIGAIVSGLVLYVPFMRRLAFGTLREDRSARVRRLDEHNLLGVVTLGWALVIGGTGAINAFADPLVANWRQSELAAMIGANRAQGPLDPARYGSIDRAMATAQAARPSLSPQFVGFPGGAWSARHAYAIFFQGDTPLTSHVLTPALVDAETGALVDIRTMPLTMQALMLSKPLHFGDYGGLALKLVWALLDLATIRVLWSGILLWWGKRRRTA
ncbi:PepSY domain-containing protein [Novosphingobium sp. KCTC 2891]|uniref:PepSY-associated TM helix domain-containing protein n=1 Tax=Novosphingobium sp. KCTC 2891 TaxID=2989730 RepID=UPI002222534A|nr:PepSY-associated TM helix domain-containing protein [Novosphingobium sp. KCTC 2891]MCW1383683.1 PepSY domain-containing protein [Novosphingobium sp. KCTC 2891]